MRKRILAFYDLIFYAIICGPLIVISIVSLYFLLVRDGEGIGRDLFSLITFAFSFSISFVGTKLFRYCVIKNNSIHFHYFPFTTSWEKAANNIDARWNQDVVISEIKDIEIVRLTEEEKGTKVYYKHWFNKYLKINLKCGNPKYVYVGNYSNYQIKKIIRIATGKEKLPIY